MAKYWIERGVDAYRLDAAYAIPTQFLASFAGQIRAARPDIFLVGEVIHRDYVRVVRRSHLNSATQYELWKAIWSSLNDLNFFELAHALQRHAEFCQHFLPWTFVGNHDTTRTATKLSNDRHLAHALALLFTPPGTPAIHAADEQRAVGQNLIALAEILRCAGRRPFCQANCQAMPGKCGNYIAILFPFAAHVLGLLPVFSM